MALVRFLQDRRGSIAPMFAIALVPMVALTGAAVDYSRANSVRTSMQASLDAAALALSKDVTSLNSSQINQEASNIFLANFNRPEAAGVTVSATYTTNPSTITVTGSGSIQTDFMKLLGVSSIKVSTSSTVTWGMTRLRVALVLDNTGSMAQSNKMSALKTAATNLLSQLQAAASQNGDVYVSIIPFAKDVNVDPVNYTQNWVRFTPNGDNPDDSWDDSSGTTLGTCSKSGYSSQSSCTAAGTCSISGHSSQSSCTAAGSCSISGYSTQSSCTGAGTCSKSQYTTKSNCQSHSGTWTLGTWTAATWTAATWTPDHSQWTGCVMDRNQNYDTTNTAPSPATPATQFPAEQYSQYCPVPLMGLSYNWSTLNAKITSMQPNGGTNQAIGLQWGFQSLTQAPFTIPAMDPNYTYTQVIILLTDGLNTQDRWYGDGTNPSPQVDARQLILCNNIKAAGVTLYTVQVNTDGEATSTLLQQCASDSSKFFLLTSSTQIVSTFNQIGTNLSQLRISK
jgi:Flp pilus assembly protein TadG